MTQSVLIVEDDPLQHQMLATLLQRKFDFLPCRANNGYDALNILSDDVNRTIKLVIMDINMPIMGGIETLSVMQERYPTLPVIILTGSNEIEDAIAAMKLGATDFLTKPCQAERLVVTIQNTLKLTLLSQEVVRLKNEKNGTVTFESLIGHDRGLTDVVSVGRKAAKVNLPVLITGETGTGKEIFAHAIHGESERSGRPFIAINCGAIPPQLVESTLFGHEKGAFTGAIHKTLGKFREAEGGTLFLDEVGELPLETQVKLLRVLQQKEVEPVGASCPVPINVRIISATNKNLQDDVNSKIFREDLFFRLNVLHITLPPLRDRRADIPSLVAYFIDRFCVYGNSPYKNIDPNALKHLIAQEWRGNVRELENMLNRAMAVSEGDILNQRDFIVRSENPQKEKLKTSPHTNGHIEIINNHGAFMTYEEIEKAAMQIALDYFSNNVTRAARALNIAKSTFYRKLKK